MTEGLRERKKRQTRQRISEAALGLFVERGFDHVTIAEVAAAAEVSVNTLYNYYEAKEDLVLPPDQASPQRLADIVRARQPGESAARAVLDRLRDELRRRDRSVGLTAGFGRAFDMMRAAPALTARLEDLGRQMTDALATVLAEETGAAPDDQMPRRIVAGGKPDAIAEAVLQLLGVVEELLSEQALTYAVREG